MAREKSFTSVNLMQGYQPVRIVSPLELIYSSINRQKKREKSLTQSFSRVPLRASATALRAAFLGSLIG